MEATTSIETMSEQKKVYPRKLRKSPFPQIDQAKWLTEIRPIEEVIRTLKRAMRASGHNISCQEAMELARFKKSATTLYQIRAASHGRLHLRSKALVEQAEGLGDLLKEYRPKAA